MTDGQKLDVLLSKATDMEQMLEKLDQRMDRLDQRVEKLEHLADRLGRRMENLEQKTEKLGRRMENLEQKADQLDQGVKNIDIRLRKVEITLEEETNKNIQLIAEGHLNLDRNLDEALKSLYPNTLYYLKANHLDGEVHKIKEAIGMA